MTDHSTPLKAGFAYFLIVYGFGFVLGTVRTLWIVPQLGARSAEMLELPLMIGISAVTARWLVRRYGIVPPNGRSVMGATAFVLLVAAEFATAWVVRGVTPVEDISSRDPISGTLFLIAIVLFALMPVLVGPATKTA